MQALGFRVGSTIEEPTKSSSIEEPTWGWSIRVYKNRPIAFEQAQVACLPPESSRSNEAEIQRRHSEVCEK